MIKIILKGQEFELDFPNNGQFVKIEEFKLIATYGEYGMLKIGAELSSITQDLLDTIDGVSYFGVLIPNFSQLYNVPNPMTILMDNTEYNPYHPDMTELRMEYQTKYKPFFNSFVEEAKQKNSFRLSPETANPETTTDGEGTATTE